jgi:hypothetical protein
MRARNIALVSKLKMPVQRAFQMPMPTFQMPPGETALLQKE